MVGTGEHLWTLAEHCERTQDEAWLKTIAPEVGVCQWIVAQRAKTKRVDSRGQPVPEYGLFPPGVTADWNRYAYRFFNDAQYCAGLNSAAQMLAQAGHPDAPRLLEDAKQYREDLLRLSGYSGSCTGRASGGRNLGAGRSGATRLSGTG